MIEAGDMVRFTRWRALGWTPEPPARRVLDVRVDEFGEQEITFTGLTWGPAKHFEVVADLNRVQQGIAADRAARGVA